MTNMICCSILITFAIYYKVSQQRTGVKFVKRRDKTKANLNKSKPRSFLFGCYEKWPGSRYLQSEVNIMLSHLSANKVFRFFLSRWFLTIFMYHSMYQTEVLEMFTFFKSDFFKFHQLPKQQELLISKELTVVTTWVSHQFFCAVFQVVQSVCL